MSTTKTLRIFYYAMLGIPLGFVGLPLYVHLPKYYADTLPFSLATIGGIMFIARLFDCFADPWIGYVADRFAYYRKAMMAAAAFVIAAGVYGLFYVPRLTLEPSTFYVLIGLLLSATYLAYSVLSINFYAAGLNIGSGYLQTMRISSWREAMIILGVLIASVIPPLLMTQVNELEAYHIFTLIFIAVLFVTYIIFIKEISRSSQAVAGNTGHWRIVLSNQKLRWIFALFFLNAIAPSITSTLFMFYVADILKSPVSSGGFLMAYFLCALIAMPLWTKLANHIGKRLCLTFSMLLALASFAGTYGLDEHTAHYFWLICALSGAAVGGDLAILPSILADAIGGDKNKGGIEFGIWNFISKFTLAMAAGISLPLLDYLGYRVGTGEGLGALAFGYALLPCLFKVLALLLLLFSPIDKERT